MHENNNYNTNHNKMTNLRLRKNKQNTTNDHSSRAKQNVYTAFHRCRRRAITLIITTKTSTTMTTTPTPTTTRSTRKSPASMATNRATGIYLKSCLLHLTLLLVAFATPTCAANKEHVRTLEVYEGVAVGHQIGYIDDFSNGIDSRPPYIIVSSNGNGVDSDLAINGSTGEIRTKVKLDRETRDTYNLVAISFNGVNVRVVVNVIDENDNAPTFPTDVMNIEFPENTPRDVKRTLHPARDLDSAKYNTKKYNIVSGNVNNAFRLSSHRERDGVLYLDLQIQGFLDRETTPAYSLLIEALDGGTPPLRGLMTVNITIQDVNDNQPIFNQSRYFATVPENATVGTSVLQVYASDTDADENGLVEYAINRRQSDKEQMFRIDPQTGVIYINKPLDFETKELHELVVVAKDHGEQPLETTAFVSIRVTDVNDNQPTINVIFLSDDASPKISESAQPGEFVARISVNDPDSKTEYANVNVSLKGGDGHFELATRDNSIYLVIVNLPLDRESTPNYTLSVVATDKGTPPLHASKTIFLRVTDVNDNAPEFEQQEYHANVMEVADPGTSVLQVVAYDRDEGNNSAVSYALAETPETHANWFQIDTHTGLITTRSHIDCETEPVPQLTVIAKDSGHPPLSSTTTVLVTIHDVNDNEPIFDQSFYNVSVAENEPLGRCILKVSASDPDCGVNAMVNYTLGEGFQHLTEFEVRSTSGEICIASELDYERRNSYEFPVLATDRGGLSTTAMIKIQLTDVNDNRPVFYPREYNVSLRESASTSASATPIVSVVATDPDSGRFGTVSYRIVAGNEASIFRIDRTSGEIFINRPNMLSVRTQSMHVLNISASDGGGQRTATDAVVFLSIIDATQRPPIFEKTRYNFYVKEDVPRNSIVGTVTATSGDGASRSPVRYSIYSGDPEGYFGIDATTGNIHIANPLDHESKAQVLLNIQATCGEPPVYGHTQVNVEIQDVNDNAPEFESSLVRISVPENAELGTPVYAAHAHDKDSGKSGEVSYSLSMLPSSATSSSTSSNNNNASRHMSPLTSSLSSLALANGKRADAQTTALAAAPNLFAIDARSGHLTLSRHLDYESTQRHSLIVTATDAGQPPLAANLTILVDVQDVNDNPPLFERNEYTVKVLESLPINSQIIQVNAIDLDTGNNARITYRIVASSNVTTTISSNINANHRQTTRTPSGIDAQIAQLFGIFPNSGWIYLRGALDRETRDRYELTVLASDNGTPAAHARARVLVHVLDANDNDPRFLHNAYEFSVEENSRRGSLVGIVGATDMDLGENAAIRFALIPTNTSFQVNPVTGEITTREPLDREIRAIYDLVAEARDQGSPARSTRVPVKVHVTDVNDNTPDIVDPQDDVVSVREEQPPGTEVVRIRAIDRDNGQNATVTYTILKGRDSDGYGLFTIDEHTGVIRTRVLLDHEERSIYRLAVAATDGGNPPKQALRMLRVEVLDLNDNRPTFTSSSLVFRVREDASVGQIVGSIGPNERGDQQNIINNSNNDEDNNLYVTYTLTSLAKDHIEGAFDIDRHTGSLVVARRLDRELQSEYRLEIRALDMTASNNPQSSAITVKVEIADVNDNSPQWPEDPIELQVSEATPVGTVLHNFTATDADTGTNGELQYKLLRYTPMNNGNTSNSATAIQEDAEHIASLPVFTIDPFTGALSLHVPLDYEVITEYTLIVQALDQSSNVSERLQTSVTVRLRVTDINDNAPEFVSPTPSTTTTSGGNAATLYLSDATRIGDTVVHVVAIDRDYGDNGRINYDIVSGNTDGRFRINTQTGFIELAKSLPPTAADDDHQANKHNSYNLGIRASDHGSPVPKQTLLNLQIVVQGTVSNPPRFIQSVYHASINENVQSGTFVLQVSAKTIHSGDNANLTYEIPTGVADNHFHVDSQRGIVTTRGQFDRESKARYTIPIYVRDVNRLVGSSAAAAGAGRKQRSSDGSTDTIAAMTNGQFDITTIIITIEDINDHAPEFRPGSCHGISIPENSEAAVMHTVVATDLDEGQNGEIVYSIIGGNLGNKFSIDSRTGELTARPLDREQHSRYTLQLQAADRGTPNSYQGHCNISVIVEDLNDNEPRFELPKYVAHVAEDAAVGTSVLRIKATDADLGVNARLVYALANETQWQFAIDSKSGLITTVGKLDREREAMYNFMVVATDGGRYEARSSLVPVQIIVDDVNDNKPVFERYPFRAQVPALIQPGQMLLQVSALDGDQGMNAEVLYALKTDDASSAAIRSKFRINPNTGVLSATQSLASASGRLLQLEVIARDKGTPAQSTVGLIELRVGEMPADAPLLRFQNETYRVKLRENSPMGTSILQVGAVRSDGRRQKISYSFGAGNEDNVFTLDATSGEIKVRNAAYLDYERFSKLDELNEGDEVAQGRGRAMHYDDGNANRDSVDRGRDEHVGFDNATNLVVAHNQNDNNNNDNSNDSNNDNSNGKANQKRSQRELRSFVLTPSEAHELRLVLVARTDGSPQLFSYAELIVELEDENDNSPHFTQQQYAATVWEGNSKGTFVMQVKAFDADGADANSRLRYHIVDGNHDNAFVIEPAFSGIVKTNIVLDREIRDIYKLKVIATDEGVPQMTGTATIRVHIVDVNDNQPTFPPHSVISVSEGTELGTVITTISANDVDTYPALTYRFSDDGDDSSVESENKALFGIDRYSGKVVLKRSLDYEVQQEYELEIIATDAAHEARTTLTVRVSDENDNAPIFLAQQPPAYFAMLPAAAEQVNNGAINLASAPLELLTLNATDADSEGRNSQIHYSIDPPVPGFSVNDTSGVVLVNISQLSAVANSPSGDYFVLISAQDAGQPPMKSNTVLRVHPSSSANGHAQFLQTQYRAQINEAAPLGTVVLRLSHDVLDASADYANLMFSIIAGNEDGVFELLQSKAIILVKPLDRELNDLYKLRLVMSERQALISGQQVAQVADNSSSAINVFVTVLDANDNKPKFDALAKYEAEISELAPLRHSIAQLVAIDGDLENTPYSEVVYDITSGNDERMFTIDLVSGMLFVNNKLDYDSGAMCYELIIRACDSAPLPLCTLQPFRLTLHDENDNAPRFPVVEYIEFVGENEPVGTSVFTARASDLDRGPFGQLNYSIVPAESRVGGGASGAEPVESDTVSWKLFRVDAQTGVVTANVVFNYEQRSRYDFVLRATDIGGRRAHVKVRIQIESKDEYTPQFTERTYRFVLPSSSRGYLPLGFVVGQVTATDADRGPDGRVVYQLSTQHAYFKVNRTTGAVLIKKKLDDNFDSDGRGDISLVISASSGRQGSLTNMTVVEISLDPLADPGTNLASSIGIGGAGSGNENGISNWALGLLIAFLLVLCAAAGIFLFIHMRSRRPRNVVKPHLNTETVGNSNSYVDPSAFDTIPIRGGVTGGAGSGMVSHGVAIASGQFAPPKYDEIPPYGPHPGSSNSGAATTSELSGSEQSGSSGRGSAEDDGEDEEIRMINEGPLHQRGGGGAGAVGSDDGRISDISVQNTQEYLARLGIVDRDPNGGASTSSRHCSESLAGSNKDSHMHHTMPMVDSLHMFDEDPASRSDITNLIYAKLNDVTGAGSERGSSADDAATTAGSIGTAVDHVIGYGDVPVVVGSGNVGPSMNGSLSSIVHSEEELTGSYNWDYLLDWGPQYQPLAHVFSEIARLKDDTMSVHSGNSGASSNAKSKQSLAHAAGAVKPHIPPPLLTNVAPRSINMPVLASGLRLPPNAPHHLTSGPTGAGSQYMLPRSPISHDTTSGFSTSSAMSPSFSPSLSPLATRSPSISPLGGAPTTHHMVSLPRHAPPQPTQRANVGTRM